jgi:delta1-piperideine-2-carboxylate reductase
MATIDLSLKEIYDLAREVLENNGCDETSSKAVANTVCTAERDGSASHGLFRMPGYVKSLKSKKVNGNANPTINNLTQNAIRVDDDYGFAPVAINFGIPTLIEITKKHGIGF